MIFFKLLYYFPILQYFCFHISKYVLFFYIMLYQVYPVHHVRNYVGRSNTPYQENLCLYCRTGLQALRILLTYPAPPIPTQLKLLKLTWVHTSTDSMSSEFVTVTDKIKSLCISCHQKQIFPTKQ